MHASSTARIRTSRRAARQFPARQPAARSAAPGGGADAAGLASRTVDAFGLRVTVVASAAAVVSVTLGQGGHAEAGVTAGSTASSPPSAAAGAVAPAEAAALADRAAQELVEYFAGRRRRFSVPVDLSGLTDFRRRVLAACARIPFGETRTYAELGADSGAGKGAARAVGQALGANPVPVLIPCHRVVAAGGGLGGFSAGLEWKRRLLAVEGR